MDAVELIQHLRSRGLAILLLGDKVRVYGGPGNKLCEAERELIRRLKTEMVAELLHEIPHPYVACWMCDYFLEAPVVPRHAQPGSCTATPWDGFALRWPAASAGLCFRPNPKLKHLLWRHVHEGGTTESAQQSQSLKRSHAQQREGPPYPDGMGRVKCYYCAQLVHEKWCQVKKETMFGISLLCDCSDFSPAPHNNGMLKGPSSQLAGPKTQKQIRRAKGLEQNETTS